MAARSQRAPQSKPGAASAATRGMEAVSLAAAALRARASSADGVSEAELIALLHARLCGGGGGGGGELSVARRAATTWLVLYVGALLLYFTCSSLDLLALAAARWLRRRRRPAAGAGEGARGAAKRGFYDATQGDYWLVDGRADIWGEIRFSVRSLAIMSALSVPLEVGVQLGYSKVYDNVSQFSVAYLLLSPVLFLLVSDCAIYFIHRGLHHRSIYKYIHKPHHSYIHTTAFAAFAFHPLDGFFQGVSYQLFVYIFPLHTTVHIISMAAVLMWTVNIHDRASVGIPGVNGAAHHTIHHTTFKSNYGQYFTFWDKVCGTFRDPYAWENEGAPVLSEKEVYGKDA